MKQETSEVRLDAGPELLNSYPPLTEGCFGWIAQQNLKGANSGTIKANPMETSLLVLTFLIMGFVYGRRLLKGIPNRISANRFDLLQYPRLGKLVANRTFSFWIRLPSAILLLIVLATGFWGVPNRNLAPSFTWLFWWTALIFFVAFAGKIFCSVCPWDFFANLIQFGGRYKKGKAPQSFNLKWPKMLKNIYPATGLFIVLTWLELGFDITRNGMATAALGLGMVCLAVVCALLYERRPFCRYLCPVGRISGLYAQFSPLELRTRETEVCRTCKGKECVQGTENTTPCPTQQIPFKMNQNTYCTLCTECIRSCPNDNLTLKLRPPASDLVQIETSRKDESLLALIMLTLTYFHGLTMTTTWFSWTTYTSQSYDLTYRQSFTILMALILIGALVFFKVFDRLGPRARPHQSLILTLAYAFITLALGYHLGHNAMHLFGESLYLVPAINDPFGFGWNLFGLASFQPYPLFGPQTMKWMQLVPLLGGFWLSVKILSIRIARITTDKHQQMTWYLKYYGLLLVLALLALWLIAQPMAMKSGF